MRNASGQQGEASKVKMSGKFHVVVVQNNGKEMYKKVCCTCEVVFCY